MKFQRFQTSSKYKKPSTQYGHMINDIALHTKGVNARNDVKYHEVRQEVMIFNYKL